MRAIVNPLDKIAAIRLLEFFSRQVPWHRSLWGIGVTLAMEEFCEGCIAMRQGHLSEASIKRMSSALQKRVGAHPGFQPQEKKFLQQQLVQVPKPEGAAHFGIRDLCHRVSTDYLQRWATVVAKQNYAIEGFARSVAAHLLDAGFAEQFLHDLVKTQLNAQQAMTLPELCELLQGILTSQPRREYEVLIAFSSIPRLQNGLPADWLQGPQVPTWLTHHGFDTTGIRAPAAIVVKVNARDDIGAAKAAKEQYDRFSARSILSTGRPLKAISTLWVKGAPGPSFMHEISRGVNVKELFRENRIFSSEASQSVDAALELLAHLEASSAPAAVAGGWAAIEGLLADPSDRASAADNLASLVTCSFPRAELTLLAHRTLQKHPGAFLELEQATTNRERARVLASLIMSDRLPAPESIGDQAAVLRVKKLLLNPGAELSTIKEAVSESFHRLYRQRNLILHGGRLDSVALTASLRTVAKLAGAGLDRITHGHYVKREKPLELVARANLSLNLASNDSPLACVDLLEPN